MRVINYLVPSSWSIKLWFLGVDGSEMASKNPAFGTSPSTGTHRDRSDSIHQIPPKPGIVDCCACHPQGGSHLNVGAATKKRHSTIPVNPDIDNRQSINQQPQHGQSDCVFLFLCEIRKTNEGVGYKIRPRKFRCRRLIKRGQ